MTPGRFLELRSLKLVGMSPSALAKAVSVDPPRNCEIVSGDRYTSADTALGFARFFGTSAQ